MVVGNHTLPTDLLSGGTCTSGMMFCISKWASDVTTGSFWILMLLAFCAAIFMATIRFGSVRAFGFASWVGMIGGIWLSILTFIPWWIGSSFIIVGVIGTVTMIMSEK